MRDLLEDTGNRRVPVIIGVTGSRTWKSREMISDAFDEAFHDFGELGYPNIVIEGGAGGADGLCKIEAIRRGWHPAQMPALWGYYGKREAGHVRNDAMIYLGMHASCWLAFINSCVQVECLHRKPHDTHGTAQCVKAARKAGIDVREYRNG